MVHFVYIRSKLRVIIGDLKKSFFLKHPVGTLKKYHPASQVSNCFVRSILSGKFTHGLRYRVGRVRHVPPNIFNLNTTPMGVAWKESTPEGLRPTQYSKGGETPEYTPLFLQLSLILLIWSRNMKKRTNPTP